ncbi:hypothetical protein [Cupriavidus necator]
MRDALAVASARLEEVPALKAELEQLRATLAAAQQTRAERDGANRVAEAAGAQVAEIKLALARPAALERARNDD